MIRTPTRSGRDCQLWTGRHFFWPNCGCCPGDDLVYVGGDIGGGTTGDGLFRATGIQSTYQWVDGTSTRKIRVGKDGKLWTLGTGSVLSKRNFDTSVIWTASAGTLMGLDVDAAGNAYCVVTTKVRKYDEDGVNVLEFDHNAQVPESIAVDPSGNIFVLDTELTASGGYGLAKYDADGVEIWQFDDDGNAGEIACDKSGNVFLARGPLRKYDPDGVLLWTASDPADTAAVRVCTDADDNAYVHNTSGGATMNVAKYDGATGDLVWECEIIDGYAGTAFNGALCAAGGFVYSAHLYQSGDPTMPVAHKIDAASGLLVWNSGLQRNLRTAATAPGVACLFQ